MKLPRGIRNNNPLNVRRSHNDWFGLRRQQTDPEFAQFVTMRCGFRAAFRILHTYYHVYDLRTVREVITRWAPDNENDTARYISTVMTQLIPNGIVRKADEVLPAPEEDMIVWCNIVRAMYRVECGAKAASLPTTWADITDGWKMAFP